MLASIQMLLAQQVLDMAYFLRYNFYGHLLSSPLLTDWGRVTHICVGKTTIIGSDNGLAPTRRQAIIWTNAGILLIGTLGKKLQWNFTRMSFILIQENAYENVVWKMAAILSRPRCVKIYNPEEICCFASPAGMIINSNTGLKCWPWRCTIPSGQYQALFTEYAATTIFAWILDVS